MVVLPYGASAAADPSAAAWLSPLPAAVVLVSEDEPPHAARDKAMTAAKDALISCFFFIMFLLFLFVAIFLPDAFHSLILTFFHNFQKDIFHLSCNIFHISDQKTVIFSQSLTCCLFRHIIENISPANAFNVQLIHPTP